MFKLLQPWPLGPLSVGSSVSSKYFHPCMCVLFSCTSFFSGTTWSSGLIWYISSSDARSSLFSWEHWILLLKNGIRNQNKFTKCTHCYWKLLCIYTYMYSSVLLYGLLCASSHCLSVNCHSNSEKLWLYFLLFKNNICKTWRIQTNQKENWNCWKSSLKHHIKMFLNFTRTYTAKKYFSVF